MSADTILVVEDEHDLAVTLQYNLVRDGYDVRLASTAEQALLEVERTPLPELVLLDLMLPDLSGTEVCRRIRSNAATRHIPIIMLTARGEEIDRVVGFEVGADDYVTKPFSVRELKLRIRAVLRRAGPTGEPGASIRFGRLSIDRDGHRVWVDDQEVILTALEFRLLALLVERRGRVQSRDRLLTDVWGISADVTTRTVDTHVKRVRHKLGAAGPYIETLRGVGYRCRAEPGGDSV